MVDCDWWMVNNEAKPMQEHVMEGKENPACKLRRLRRTVLLGCACFPAWSVVVLAMVALDPDPHPPITIVLGIGLMVTMLIWFLWLTAFWHQLVHWRCPNCGRWYHWIGPFMNPFAGDCQKCGWHP